MSTKKKAKEWNFWELKHIERPANHERSNAAWARIGYKPTGIEKPIGYATDRYNHPYPLFSHEQVEPIAGAPAKRRRTDYHAYLFRLRVYRAHALHISNLHANNPDDALIFVVELMENIALWKLGELVQIPEILYDFDVLVVTDALKTVPPLSPYALKENDSNSSDEGVL